MKPIKIEFTDDENIIKLTAEIEPEHVLDDLDESEIAYYCQGHGIDIEVEIPEIEIPLSGPPQNLHEHLCIKFDLPRLTTTKADLLNHINALL